VALEFAPASGVFRRDGTHEAFDDPLARLAQAALRGDAVSERALVEHLRAPLLRFLERSARSPQDIEDSLQESMIAVLRALPTFRGQSSFLYFALGVARLSLRTSRRGQEREAARIARLAVLERPLAELGRPADLASEQRSKLLRLLSELPKEQSNAFLLRVLDDLSLHEVATVTGACKNTVRTRLRLARAGLCKRIERDADLLDLFRG
jgi:RNA polymerase sigma-70 factor (ECF subfamily)